MATGIQIVFDCADPARLAQFWAEVLGYHLAEPPPGYASWQEFSSAVGGPDEEWNAVVDPAGTGPRVFFHRAKPVSTSEEKEGVFCFSFSTTGRSMNSLFHLRG